MKTNQQMSGISRKSGLIIFFTLLVLGVSFFIFDNTSVPTARAWDIKWGYYAILLTFIAFIVGIVLNGKDFVCRVREHLPSGKSLIALVALLLFFVIFSLNHIENSHRVLSDETSWESMGLQMRFAHSGG
ncbi:MAG: glycosyl hydrolase family 98, partial [Fibrobacteraceae bacterium]|nr:glycosyl hydrolase family 98 [Fibrobacteraceae bacterium]